MYSNVLLDHFKNPRNVGELERANVVIEVSNPVCGDVLKLSARMENTRIAEIRFKAKGCVASMACASALTELAQGKSVDEARALNRENVIAAVGGIPQASAHAAQLSLDALTSALDGVKP